MLKHIYVNNCAGIVEIRVVCFEILGLKFYNLWQIQTAKVEEKQVHTYKRLKNRLSIFQIFVWK